MYFDSASDTNNRASSLPQQLFLLPAGDLQLCCCRSEEEEEGCFATFPTGFGTSLKAAEAGGIDFADSASAASVSTKHLGILLL
jgi:hypothetical protein